MDVCCLNRPFDDQTQQRIHLETEAVLLILEHCQSGDWQLLDSEVIHFEIERIPDEERRQKVALLVSLAGSVIRLSERVIQRAATLEARSISAVDALHLACAEEGDADIFPHHRRSVVAEGKAPW